MAQDVIELNAHDITRVWHLAIAIYDGDDEDADLRDFFAQALSVYLEFMDDLSRGGLEFTQEEEGVMYVSERELGPTGDTIRFRAKPLPAKEPKKKKARADDDADDKPKKKSKK